MTDREEAGVHPYLLCTLRFRSRAALSRPRGPMDDCQVRGLALASLSTQQQRQAAHK